MAQLTVRKTWRVNGTLTAVTSITLGVVRDDTQAVVLAAGTAMPAVATGVYEYTLPTVDGGTTYTATITVVYAGQTYVETVVCVPEVAPASIEWPDGFKQILSQLMSLAALITLNPNPNVSVHGHSYSNGEYLEILGRQIEQFTKLHAQAHPFEIVSRGN